MLKEYIKKNIYFLFYFLVVLIDSVRSAEKSKHKISNLLLFKFFNSISIIIIIMMNLDKFSCDLTGVTKT